MSQHYANTTKSLTRKYSDASYDRERPFMSVKRAFNADRGVGHRICEKRPPRTSRTQQNTKKRKGLEPQELNSNKKQAANFETRYRKTNWEPFYKCYLDEVFSS